MNDLAHAIEYALSMGDTERRERHRQNYMHVTIHTAQVRRAAGPACALAPGCMHNWVGRALLLLPTAANVPGHPSSPPHSHATLRTLHSALFVRPAPARCQTWADTFISELNDTHVEAELRTRNIPPQLDLGAAVGAYRASRRRLLVLGYNATLTTAVEAPRQPKKHFDQIQALTRVNPAAYRCLAALAQNPDTQVGGAGPAGRAAHKGRVGCCLAAGAQHRQTAGQAAAGEHTANPAAPCPCPLPACHQVVIFSGSQKEKLEEVFGGLNVWLAAENGIYLRPPHSVSRWVGQRRQLLRGLLWGCCRWDTAVTAAAGKTWWAVQMWAGC